MKAKSLLLLLTLASFSSVFGAGLAMADVSTSDATASPIVRVLPKPADKTEEKKKAEFRYRLGLSGESFENQKEQAQTAGFGAEGDLRYHLTDQLEFKVQARLILQSGQAQTQFGDNVPQSGVFLTEAIITYRPVHAFSVAAGAIDQAYLRSPLLVSARPFPGVDEKIIFGDTKLGAEFRAEQTIPTSISLSTRVSENDPTPYFLAETFTLLGTPDPIVKLEGYVTHYYFSPLPSSVALDSAGFGNTSAIQGGTESETFLYRYNGILGGTQATLRLVPDFKVIGGAQLLDNTAAPAASREGFLSYLETPIRASQTFTFSPRAEYFFNESDSSPAFYNSSEYGHNNRRGYAGQVEMNFVKAGFKVKGRYVDADLINPNANQSRQQYYLISFETLYAKI